MIKARIERPLLPKDVLALRSAQSRTLDVSWCIFDENHRLIGRQVFLSGIPEGDSIGNADLDAQSFFAVGGVTARNLDSISSA